jgi:hypothetical protein
MKNMLRMDFSMKFIRSFFPPDRWRKNGRRLPQYYDISCNLVCIQQNNKLVSPMFID